MGTRTNDKCFVSEKARVQTLAKRLQWHVQRGGATPWQQD